MPRGDKSAYTDTQKRQAEHIEESYEHHGVSEDEAERRAWATVNKKTGGGKKSGSGRGKKQDHAPSRKGGNLGGATAASRPAAARSASAKKAAARRKRKPAAVAALSLLAFNLGYDAALSMLEDQMSALFIDAAVGMLWQLRQAALGGPWQDPYGGSEVPSVEPAKTVILPHGGSPAAAQ